MSDIIDNDLHGSGDESLHMKKRRVGKACDCCRMKKTKCNGVKPCLRCITHNQLCSYTERHSSYHKEYPEGYVELLEARLTLLTRSLHKLYQMVDSGEDISILEADGKKELGLNKLVSLLDTKNQEQVDDPGVWEEGLELATKFDENDSNYIDSACAEFAEHYKASMQANKGKRKRSKRGRKPKMMKIVKLDRDPNVKSPTEEINVDTNAQFENHVQEYNQDYNQSSSPSLPPTPPKDTNLVAQKMEHHSPLSSLFHSSDDTVPMPSNTNNTTANFLPTNQINNVQIPNNSNISMVSNNIEDAFLEQSANFNTNEQLFQYGYNSNPDVIPMRFWPYPEIPEGYGFYNEMNGYNFYPQLANQYS